MSKNLFIFMENKRKVNKRIILNSNSTAVQTTGL